MNDTIQELKAEPYAYRAEAHLLWQDHLEANFRKLVVRFIAGAPENMRYQIGRSVSRVSNDPKYDGLRLVGVVNGGGVNVFKLLGWGKTPEAAEAMMKGAL